ncbi:hypothetical protein KFK09_013364 [Dendrobium nobile]|uniref:Uncharacterized protein n=1 Tax=Dendrobium nobile TaxID=94219 RepID=A0A8T3B9E4_DENNO|nr:hypothetical protein KFK09_013364 [Dendrobium nobile]
MFPCKCLNFFLTYSIFSVMVMQILDQDIIIKFFHASPVLMTKLSTVSILSELPSIFYFQVKHVIQSTKLTLVQVNTLTSIVTISSSPLKEWWITPISQFVSQFTMLCTWLASWLFKELYKLSEGSFSNENG